MYATPTLASSQAQAPCSHQTAPMLTQCRPALTWQGSSPKPLRNGSSPAEGAGGALSSSSSDALGAFSGCFGADFAPPRPGPRAASPLGTRLAASDRSGSGSFKRCFRPPVCHLVNQDDKISLSSQVTWLPINSAPQHAA